MPAYFRIEHNDVAIPQGIKLVKAHQYVDLIQAKNIVEKARIREQEIVALAAQMYEQEKKRGYEEGMAGAKAERAEAIQLVNARYASYVEEVEQDLYQIVSSILTKIIGKLPAEELMLSMIAEALSKYTKKSTIKLTINNELVNKVGETLKTIVSKHPFLEHINIVGDLNVPKSTCLLETKFEVIELNLQEQLTSVVNIMQKLQPVAVNKKPLIQEVRNG